MQEGEEEKYLNLETELSKRVVGQDEAVSAISNAIRTSRIELSDKKKPMGSYLFL
ncbi:MAG: hypothetical protein LBD11_02600 [Candidatus Peribacteria bacterium]|jgi:ATP-dependent Clp protease ATP-binding subunit ClpB|nr:hypothetical protein [Candidatus Peribacteria bacterium]